MGRRSNGEGTVYKTASGYGGQIMLGGTRYTRSGKTKAEVRAKLAQLKKDHEAGLDIGSQKQTLEAYLVYWLDHVVKQTNGPRTHKRYSELANGYLIPGLGTYKLRELRPQHVQVFLEKLPEKLSATTKGKIRGALITALNSALRERLVEYNAAALSRPVRQEKFHAHVITQEEAGRFRAAIKGHRLEALYLIAMSLGPRKGELLGLRKKDIDFERGTIHIQGQIQLIDGELTWGPTKTGAARRKLTLTPEALRAVRRAYEASSGGEWLFPSRAGTPISPRSLVRQFKALLKKAKLPAEIRFHDLRHFAATRMLSLGAPLHEVKRILGHTEASTTLNTYAHALPDETSTAVKTAIAAIFTEEDDDE